VADGSAGLRIIDISVPATPSEIGYYDSVRIVYDVCYKRQYAFLADGNNGLVVLDISNPTQPVKINKLRIELVA